LENWRDDKLIFHKSTDLCNDERLEIAPGFGRGSELQLLSGFADYQIARASLTQRCETAESLWREATVRTELERLTAAGDAGNSAVGHLLAEARQRLASSTVEVGIFGSIKRGKSTLINALVGAEVSPMRVTPETAVPVWIESGPPMSRVLLADGAVLSDLSIEQAHLMSTQRYKAKDLAKKPLRVEHSLRVPWLPKGVRIVDTPGLDDPSLAEDFENLTLAELDRVAATVFVMVSPPGPSGEEIRLLKTLGSRAVDKLFLVCNFYPDHWNDPEIVAEMTGYIERIVAEGAAQGVDVRDVRVFPVSAKQGYRAALAKDHEQFEASGIERLRSELEEYLSQGVLDRMLGFVEQRLQMVGALIADTLYERRRILSSPQLAEPAREAARKDVAQSKVTLAEILVDVERLTAALAPDLSSVLAGPFDTAVGAVEKAGEKSQLEQILSRLRLQFETAASEASTLFSQRAGLEQIRLQRRLFDSFGVEERLKGVATNLGLQGLGDIAPSIPQIGVDKDAMYVGGALSAAVGGVSLATIAGGTGLALIAAGPVGWLIGLGLGALFGGGLGAVVARAATKDDLKPEHRQQVIGELKQHEARVRSALTRSLNEWKHATISELEAMRSSFFAERENELRRIEQIIGDETTRIRELSRVEELIERVKAIAS
jgi:hypothetical protein